VFVDGDGRKNTLPASDVQLAVGCTRGSGVVAQAAATPDRVKRLFEADGLRDALTAQDRKAAGRPHLLPASCSDRSTTGDVIRSTASSLKKHADEIQYWLVKISNIREKLKNEERRLKYTFWS
jgi:hypothetical protein